MKIFFLSAIILFIFSTSGVFAQKKVFKGRVIDGETNKPLEYVSVYVTNSTIGTLTNDNGGFVLMLDPGKYEVVVSLVGYEPIIHPIMIKNDGSSMAPVLFKISQQAYALNAVSVTGKRDASWYSNLKLFKEYFLGKSAIAQKCKLLNPDALIVEFNVEKQTLTVTAKEPLKIQNPELGYNISFLLIEFVLNKYEGYVSYLGYPHFELMDGKDSQKRQWVEKRLEVFQGSSMHFARSLRDQKLQQEGFRVTRDMTNEDVAYDEYISYPHNDPDNEAKMEFKGALRVVYLRKMEDLEYVYANHRTGVKKASYQTSKISLKDQYVLLDKNGRFEKPLGIIFNGYWSWDKVGDMLPFDYNPQ